MPFPATIHRCVPGFKASVTQGTAIFIALVTIILLLAPHRAQAHSFHVFALGDGDIIEGYAYFGGGARPHHAAFSIEGSDGKVLLTGQTNDNGEFRLRVDHLDDYTIRANTGDGHAASYIVKSSELADDLPKATATSPASVIALNATEDAPNTDIALSTNTGPSPTSSVIAPENPRITITAEQLSSLVSHAVAKQVNPLREQIVAYENKVRFSDIMGGLGIIIGIFGTIAWWQARKRVSPPPE
ncbi:hypothetical protein [Thalassospira sp. TSL5-1]|uniref:hypothetical protein n=1 Tax=Thalassospira sp. TSL5-1 TaxID=1544451 RepID=UPI00093B44CE|nr:hypothetical protein [Thalassospira sp. TSL5-1]OKH89844.1 hypothetical protein LF95_08045 [Thalassospira sp. TSL5-1]